MDAKVLLSRVDALEKQIARGRQNDAKTKYQLISSFKGIKKTIEYRIPMTPISESDRIFQCPRCNMRYEIVEGYDISDFICCPYCGQLFKEVEEDV